MYCYIFEYPVETNYSVITFPMSDISVALDVECFECLQSKEMRKWLNFFYSVNEFFHNLFQNSEFRKIYEYLSDKKSKQHTRKKYLDFISTLVKNWSSHYNTSIKWKIFRFIRKRIDSNVLSVIIVGKFL